MGDEMDAMRWNVVGIDGGGADEGAAGMGDGCGEVFVER
jgi:hypothetical protein